MDLQILSRAEARELGLKRYFTNIPCKQGHLAERFVSVRSCVECERERGRRRFISDPGQSSLARSERGKRTGATALRSRMRRRNDPEAANAATAAWRARNPQKNAAQTMRRQAAKIMRTPRWLTPEDWSSIKSKYSEARSMTLVSGVAHQVDHIVPLRGKSVCGLHVPWNLRVIPARENAKKSNRLTRDITML